MARKICVVTGTRAEYGLLKPVMRAIQAREALELAVLVTGMHLDPEFGNSYQLIEADGFAIDARIPLDTRSDDGLAMARSVGAGTSEMAAAFQEMQPDVVLLLGDRTEALAATIAAAYLNIPLAHIHGGDRSQAGLDESVRHAITKFAHIHFPATEASAERIRRLGEHPQRIHVTGAPCLDTILHTPLLSRVDLERELECELDPNYVLLVQHPVTTEPEEADEQFRASLEALQELNRQCIVIYPNNDAGGRKIISLIESHAHLPWLHAFKSLRHAVYLSLMKHCAVMLGNSSSGVIESSSFQIPVINLGIRQKGRERAGNVVDAPHEKLAILEAFNQVEASDFQEKLESVQNPYGIGQTGIQIADILTNLSINKELLQKQITY